ncbi:MAG: metallophosphoesterase, partial [Clostridia bacterium]|nr:metallophosphoesterase [Clostridia bacterium]
MSLYAIADLHLSLGTDKPMDVFPGWDGYVSRLTENWRRLVSDEDTVVIAGDVSWGMSLEASKADFAFLNALPGRKLILKGNHDYWWNTRRKMDAFFADNGFDTLRIVHNDAVAVEDRIAVCGSRGWFFDAEAEEDRKV